MAEALFAARARESGATLSVASAGTGALVGHPSPPEAVQLMAKRGLDISNHRGQQVTEPLVRRHDLILVMEREHQRYLEGHWPMLKGRVRLLNEAEGTVADPYKRSRKTYEASLAQIDQGVTAWAEMILS